jgi:hypothetical protein
MGWKTLKWACWITVFSIVFPLAGGMGGSLRLATLWYKHGLRIGARDSLWMESDYTQQQAAEVLGVSQRKAPTTFTSLPAMAGVVSGVVLLAVAGTVAAALAFPAESGVASSERIPAAASTPQPRPPTPRGPNLTGAEAAGKAESKLRDAAEQSGDISRLRIICDAEDFNGRTDNWIVLCTFAWPTSSTDWRYYVNDRTGAVTEVR